MAGMLEILIVDMVAVALLVFQPNPADVLGNFGNFEPAPSASFPLSFSTAAPRCPIMSRMVGAVSVGRC